ncbi:MAG: 7-carboxy-7-deazaguanine synthase [Candidatus Neomarinimicrobiota bacterium]|nr:7-carboxy-7-deazaguanine synthase [Candidatus Neomarinimicrobiota bacterium]
MSYKIKETYLTIQGEGAHAGRVAIFCRFSGCNLWSGHEKDREEATCKFCDTDFVGTDGAGGGTFENHQQLSHYILSFWNSDDKPFIVFTGGEPLLQLDKKLIVYLKSKEAQIAIETNGTIDPPEGIDWICVSPKKDTELLIKKGNELKIVYPQEDLDPSNFLDLDFDVFSLQPMDDSNYNNNLDKTLEYCTANPNWRLSLQMHKYLQIP